MPVQPAGGQFVEMHRGKLEVLDSSLGGALFQVTLPNYRLRPEQTSTAEKKRDSDVIKGIIEELRPSSVPWREIEPRQPRAARTALLVVEDNIDMNRFISESLREQYEVISAFNGQEGLEKALAVRPSMIVSDIMMPVMSGAEMITEIRKRPELADTPILVLSAKADEELKLLPQVFDLFVQGQRTLERAQGGLGIGLALVRNLVELHGGRVEARSEGPNRGSEFVIELPAAQSVSLAPPPPAPSALPSARDRSFRSSWSTTTSMLRACLPRR